MADRPTIRPADRATDRRWGHSWSFISNKGILNSFINSNNFFLCIARLLVFTSRVLGRLRTDSLNWYFIAVGSTHLFFHSHRNICSKKICTYDRLNNFTFWRKVFFFNPYTLSFISITLSISTISYSYSPFSSPSPPLSPPPLFPPSSPTETVLSFRFKDKSWGIWSFELLSNILL